MKPGAAPKRVGMLLDSLVGGGAERIALNFAEKLIEAGHDAHLIVLRKPIEHDPGKVPLHLLSETGVLSRLRPLNKLLFARRLRRCTAEIERDGRKFDFLVSNAEDSDRISGGGGLPLVLILYRNSMRYFLNAKIGRSTGLKRRIRSWRWLRKFRRIYGRRHIVTVSAAMARELAEDLGIEPASLNTIYNPFDFARIRRLALEPAALPTEPYVIYAARMGERKAQHVLVRAYKEAGIPHKLVLLGGVTDAAEERYQREVLEPLIRSLGLEERVLLAGFHPNPYPWIRGAALFAMSSASEGLPTVLIESLILGTPVVSTDCPFGPDEILTGELARFLSPVGNVNALATNIRAALESYPRVTDADLARFEADRVIAQYFDLVGKLSAPASARS